MIEEIDLSSSGDEDRKNSESSLKPCDRVGSEPGNVVGSRFAKKTPKPGVTANETMELGPVIKRKPGPASKTKYYEAIDSRRSTPFQERAQLPEKFLDQRNYGPPPNGIIVRPKIILNMIVLTMNVKEKLPWIKSQVLEETFDEVTRQLEYTVWDEPTVDGIPTKSPETYGSKRQIRRVCLKMMAYSYPFPNQLPVGTRVVAKVSDGHYYAGIIADKLKKYKGSWRNLVFLDDGYAEYVHPTQVFLVCANSPNVWNDVHPDSYDFIKAYLTNYPDWPLVKLSVGQIVATSFNGYWTVSKVLEVYGAMAEVKFLNDSRKEWIYRGSARFRPVTKATVDNQAKLEPTRDLKYLDHLGQLKMFTGQSMIDLKDPSLQLDRQGTLKQLSVPDYGKRVFVPHKCSESCQGNVSIGKQLKQTNPLLVPLNFGWSRSLGDDQRSVSYISPCGVTLTTLSDLEKYLNSTNSPFSVDYFTFDLVNCTGEFVPVQDFIERADISNGVEVFPVPCVNSIDKQVPPTFEYITKHLQEIEATSSEEFLCGCECTDNCLDKSACACWKLTLDGESFRTASEDYTTNGYEGRRLYDVIRSGIFECNSRCKCRSTCSNRTSQNGAFWPLQVFKSVKTGWGVRALHDIPFGTLVCVYAGNIMDNEKADIHGKMYGDEYFATLNFVENMIEDKPGYEEDICNLDELACSADDSEDDKMSEDDEASARRMASRKVAIEKVAGNELEMFYGSKGMYTVDAKFKGNVGRFLNHSCDANLNAIHIFAGTHDLRFPQIALFANKQIDAGTEITWDYNYTIGDAGSSGNIIQCCCESPYCRGRLL